MYKHSLRWRWSHCSAVSSKNSVIKPTKSSILGHFYYAVASCAVSASFSHNIWIRVLWFGFGLSFACRAALAKRVLEREAITAGWCAQVSNTQLDSLLYPRDERSATWALPCCNLAPFGDSESCTHVDISHNNTAEAFQTACPIQTLFSQPSSQFTFVSHWQMVFLGPFTSTHRYRFLSCRPVFQVLSKYWFQFSKRISRYDYRARYCTHGNGVDAKKRAQTPDCALTYLLFLGCRTVGTPGLPSRVAGLTANSALCHSVHWLSYLSIYYSWIATSLAWNLLSDFVRVTWDAWCCNCRAFTNVGSIANVFRVILTYQDMFHGCISLAWDNNDN